MDLGGKSNYARHPDIMSLASPGIQFGGKLSRSLIGSISAGTNKVKTFNNFVNMRVKRVNFENLENYLLTLTTAYSQGVGWVGPQL